MTKVMEKKIKYMTFCRALRLYAISYVAEVEASTGITPRRHIEE